MFPSWGWEVRNLMMMMMMMMIIIITITIIITTTTTTTTTTGIRNLSDLHIWQMTGQRKTSFAVGPPSLPCQMLLLMELITVLYLLESFSLSSVQPLLSSHPVLGPHWTSSSAPGHPVTIPQAWFNGVTCS